MSMRQNNIRLRKLLKGIKVIKTTIKGNIKIKGISSDSRKIKKGFIFVAIKGQKRNGNDYIDEAIKRGAIAIITEEYADITPKICVSDAREALAILWRNFYKNPTKGIKIIAVTGTNGKTSTSYILNFILNEAKKSVGLISTIGIYINNKRIDIDGGSEVLDIPSAMTTPDPEILYKIIDKMKREGVKYLILESSSHAIAQKKLSKIKPYIGVFTNLSCEHLDFHKTMNEYYLTKRELLLKSKFKIINIDDEYGKDFYIENKKSNTISIRRKADYMGENLLKIDTGCSFLVKYSQKAVKINSRLIGDFVVYNILLAFACAKALKIKDKYIISGVKSCEEIKGRMERFCGKNVFIDSAHTPNAMESVLKSFKKQFPKKKIIVLFGCGGDRDKSKRKQMGEIASQYADELIITSDNPRTEDPKSIISDILAGVDKKVNKTIIVERKEAILFATKAIGQDGILLLLGKGHESYEINNEGKVYFDEREVLKEAFEDKW